jgi:hypothetical protein
MKKSTKRNSLAISFSMLVMLVLSGSLFALPATYQQGAKSLVLNGEGSRTKAILTVYKSGLYLSKKSSDANAIINANEPMSIKIHITSRLLTADKLSSAVREGFTNSTGSRTAMKTEIDRLLTFFSNGVSKGNIFDLSYTPETGVSIYKNGKLGLVIKGLAFKKAFYGIWLGAKPAQESLKAEMLGK